MAPRARRGESATAEPQGIPELGVRGRKTGVTLSNTGEKDAQGFQPLQDLFSSPEKEPSEPANRVPDPETEEEDDDDDAGSEDMEIASSAGPGPRTLLKAQRNSQYQLPRSRSPVKTRLLSPAKRNPHLDRLSSPLQPDRDVTVTRKIDFSSKPRRVGPNGVKAKTVAEESEEEEDVSEPEIPAPEPDYNDGDDMEGLDDVDDGYDEDDVPQHGGDLSDDVPEPLPDIESDLEPEPEPEPAISSPLQHRKAQPRSQLGASGKAPVRMATSPHAEITKSRVWATDRHTTAGNPRPQKPRQDKSAAGLEGNARQKDDRRRVADEDYDAYREERQAKRQKTAREHTEPAPPARGKSSQSSSTVAGKAKAEGTSRPRGRPPGRKRKQQPQLSTLDEDAGEASFIELQRGPPLPKRRGLVSVRRDPDTVTTTRSGRTSFKPLHFWAGDKVITEDEERADMFGTDGGFVLNSTKEIVRVDEDSAPQSKRTGRRGKGGRPKGKSKLHPVEEEDDVEDEEEELEAWEADPGTVVSEVIAWEPEYETHPPGDDDQVHISEEQIALSGEAVETREIRDATFRFAKTLTMPFMGAGVVDLPPGSEKRPKNSRKMHMVFFVHTGKVAVTVNEGNFRISKGGQWFVPRGNYYSISNDYQQPARIFFAQACEVSPPLEEASLPPE